MPLLSPSAMSLWFYLWFFICTSCLGAGDPILYAQSGHEATLSPTIHGQPENILWTHDGNKVIQFDGSEEKVYSTYTNRIILDWGSGDLTIKDLRPEDSGQYKLEVNIQGKLHSSLQDLEVIDEVAKPTISCEVNDTSGSEPWAMLMCSVGTENLSASPKFVWKLLEELKPGQELPISLGGKHDDEVYCCVVSNPVSAKNTTFTAKDCYPDKDLGPPIAFGVIGVLLCIALLVGFFCWRRRKAADKKRKAQIKDKDVEKQSQHPEQKEDGDSKDRQPLISPNEPPKCQENGESGDNQAQESDENSPLRNVAEKTQYFNRLFNPVPGERTPVRHGRKNDSAKKRPPLSDSPADTQEASGKNSAVDPEKEPLLHYSATLPSKQPLSRLNRSTPTAEPEAATSHHEEGADSDQVTEESTKTEPPETISSGLESTNKGDSVGTSEDKVSNLQLSNAPAPPSLQSTSPEPDTTESNQNQMNGPASEHDKESATVKDLEEMGEESNLSPLSPEQPEIPKQPEIPQANIPANTDNASTSQGQQDTDMPEHSLNNHEDPNMPDPKQESNSKCDSDESGELSQTDIYSAEPAEDETQNEPQTANERNESQSVPNEEEPGVSEVSEDKKSQTTDETGAEVAHDQSETKDACSEEACESEILNSVQKETKETGTDPPYTDETGETDKSGVDLKDEEDQGAEEDQGLTNNMPFSENQDGQMDHKNLKDNPNEN